MYEFILKLDLPNINEDGIKLYTTELERVAASCVSNVLTNKIKYLSKIAEIKFILKVYPQVFELLINNKLLPTDIINIRSSFTTYTLRKLETIESLDSYLDWRPSTQTLKKYPELNDIVIKESEKTIPNPSIISFKNVKNLDATILEKRAIIAESFEFITWITKIKKVKSVISSRSESNLASYYKKRKLNFLAK